MCGTRNGWMAVLEGAQNVVDGVARAARATRNTVTASLFIYDLPFLGKTLPCAPIEGAQGSSPCNGLQMSKYKANSVGVGRSRTGFSSRSILFSIQVSM